MKVASGTASGIRLDVPGGMDVRPTGVRARSALFDSLSASVGLDGVSVVDLFAGSGALGIEAASRGAASVFFIEKSPRHARAIRSNLNRIRKAGVSAELAVLVCDAMSVHRQLPELRGAVDIIFADPPYDDFSFFWSGLLSNAEFAEWAANALMIWEAPPKATLAPVPEWRVEKRDVRGGTVFIHLRTSA